MRGEVFSFALFGIRTHLAGASKLIGDQQVKGSRLKRSIRGRGDLLSMLHRALARRPSDVFPSIAPSKTLHTVRGHRRLRSLRCQTPGMRDGRKRTLTAGALPVCVETLKNPKTEESSAPNAFVFKRCFSVNTPKLALFDSLAWRSACAKRLDSAVA